jgi:type VI secretion system secreted protein VgrG
VNPKSGKAGTAVAPAAPKEPFAADNANPGKVAEIKTKEQEAGTGKYGSASKKAHAPGDGDETKTSWIEIELIDEEDEPVPGEKYEITLPDGSVSAGTLDADGFARVDGIDPGSCEVTFPELDKEAWEPA